MVKSQTQSIVSPEIAHSASFVTVPNNAGSHKKRIWIDIDNSPHVPFFLPIIDELQRNGLELTLTARDMYQVCELLQSFKVPCKVIGRHYGKNTFLKIAGTVLRASQLLPVAISRRPHLAVSHCSRAQILASKLLGIPTLMMNDYEYSTKTPFLEPDWVLMPDVIPDGTMVKKKDGVLRYPGLKEDVYVPRFHPDHSILRQLGISQGEIVVTMRPPATEAHYHNAESETLFSAALRLLAAHPQVRVVALPRNGRQREKLRRDWSHLISSGRMIIPDGPVDGLNLIWFSDYVISGGGTMNREAAALGVPVYSIFRGKIGAVDQGLAKSGRLVLISHADELKTRIALTRWKRPAMPRVDNRPALQSIVGHILSIIGAKQICALPAQSAG